MEERIKKGTEKKGRERRKGEGVECAKEQR